MLASLLYTVYISMTVFRNSGIYTIIETRFFLLLNSAAGSSRLARLLACTFAIGGQSRCMKKSGSCALETQPLHEVFRQAGSESKRYLLYGLYSSSLSETPPTLAIFLFPARAPAE